MSQKDLQKALGPLAALFDDPEIMEIMVDGPAQVIVEKNGKLESTNVRFQSNDDVKVVIQAVLAAVMGVEMEAERTIYEARLTDNSRMMAVLSPTAINGHTIVFHKWMSKQITWELLLKHKAVPAEMRYLIQRAIGAHVSMLIAGGTASGKTTFANRVVELIPPDERVVTVEQTHEFQFEHPRAVYLEAGGPAAVTMTDLLVAGSKMRPDWLIIGELNGGEALRAMQILGNGYVGLTTLHATSAENALTRLEAMCLMANLGLGLEDIRGMIVSALRLIMFQERLPDGRRKVTQVVELCGLENGRYILKPLMRYNPEKDAFELTGEIPSWEK